MSCRKKTSAIIPIFSDCRNFADTDCLHSQVDGTAGGSESQVCIQGF